MRRRCALAALSLAVLSLGCGSSGSSAATSAVTEEPPREPAPTDPSSVPAGPRDPGLDVDIEAEGVTLAGTWYPPRPADHARSDAAVLLFHQLGAERAEWDAVVAALRPLGVGVLTVDLRGHGGSIRNPAASGARAAVLWRQFANRDWAMLPGDVRSAMAFARERGARRFVLGGSSIGGSAALVAAADAPDVRAVFALSPGRSYRGIDIVEPAARFEGRILAIAAEGEAPSREMAEELARGERAAARIVPGSHHGLRMMGEFPELPRALAEFVEEVLP